MITAEELTTVKRNADCLYSEAEVEAAIAKIAAEITERYAALNPLFLSVLNGATIFCGKLLPHLDFPLELDAICASRYRGETRGSHIEWRLTPSLSLADRHVVVIDDVLDEGVTLAEILEYCRKEGAASVATVVLVDKLLSTPRPCEADFVGLKAPNRYLFGYGMDYKNYLRNAPGIYACQEI